MKNKMSVCVFSAFYFAMLLDDSSVLPVTRTPPKPAPRRRSQQESPTASAAGNSAGDACHKMVLMSKTSASSHI